MITEESFLSGRKKSIDVQKVRELQSRGLGATAIARELSIDRTSVYRVLKESCLWRNVYVSCEECVCEL